MMRTWPGIVIGWCGSPPRPSALTWGRGRVVRIMCVLSLLSSVGIAHASAQTVGMTAVNFRQYLAGAPAPVTPPFTISMSAVMCNQTPPIATLHSVSWDDADNAGKVCVYIDPGTGPLFARIFGALEGTLTNLAGSVESPESARAPFLHPPLAPTSPKVIR